MKFLTTCNHAATGFTSPFWALLRWLALALVLVGSVSPALAAKTYSDNGDGTVTDPTTGLTWMRCSMGQTWDGVNSTCTGTASTYTFDQANALTGTVTFAGQSDWRLPNIRELQTIVDRSGHNPAIDPTAFPATSASSFWSASANAGSSGMPWLVFFYDGYAYNNVKGYGGQVRLVRAGQSFGLLDVARPSTDYVDQGDGTALHTPSRLIWQRCAVGQSWTGTTCSGTPSTLTWDAAKVLTSSFAGQTDWRLPTEEELLSLVDYSKSSPAINSSLFPATSASFFWSASAGAGNSDGAWDVGFGSGSAGSSSKGFDGQVRLVRDGQCFGPFALGVNKTGAGQITNSANTGVSCDTVAGATGYYTGDVVTLTASPAANLISWGGACASAGTADTCTVTMDAAKSVTATFKDTSLITGLPTDITYAPQNKGSTSASQNITLTNTGTAALAISSIATTGDFSVTNNCGSGLGVAGFCTLNVSFSPTATGARTGTLTITSNAPGSPHTVNLSGSGQGAVASFTGPILAPPPGANQPYGYVDFSATNLGATNAMALTLNNTGGDILNISGITISGDFSNSNTCGSTLDMAATCSIVIVFSPTTAGTRTGSLVVLNDSADGAIALSGSTPALASISLDLLKGWNLLGNGQDQPLAVAGLFGNTANVTTVWKWDVATTGWQFYAPSMDAATLQSYTTGKGYGILSSINPGEGFWVNALQAFSVNQPSGVALTGADFAAGQAHALKPNWNLVALGTALTPSDFNRGLSATPPATGTVPINLTTLWAWDNPGSKWYFYSPSLEGQGGTVLFDYTASKGYLDFTATGKTLGAGMGFWVNRP